MRLFGGEIRALARPANRLWLSAALLVAMQVGVAGEASRYPEPLSPLTNAQLSASAFSDNEPAVAPERDTTRENRQLFQPRETAPVKNNRPATASNPATAAASNQNPVNKNAAGQSTAGQNAAVPNTAANRPAARNPVFMSLPILLMVAALVALFAFLTYRKHWQRGGRSLFSSPALEILGRTQLDRQKYFALLRVGKRLLVVGVTPDGFTPLAEINDEQEATELMLEARPQTPAGKNMFLELFKKHVADEKTPLPQS
ncbi:hypothetical protein FACS1894107_00900 [Planctomycetales bacterium]|nr:hypothetical protein FACS1894107_00900 [Planctomycetales bacterium]GHT00923.1 hypothetical protein FACS1894108_14030 [Planctomycetales bacterium]